MKFSIPVVVLMLISDVLLAEGHFELSAADRVDLGLTVFNDNFAVIMDRRRVAMAKNEIRLEFSDVARTIQPETVTLRTDRKKGFVAIQQNYRYDLLNRESLLGRFVGRKVKYFRSLLENGTYEKVLREGVLLSINPEIVMFGDVIEIQPEGTISLPSLPSDLRTKPTLVFLGHNSHQGAQEVTVRYHARDINWAADYTLTLAKKGMLNGWVTIHNRSGSDLAVDDLNLIAGEVGREVSSHAPKSLQRAMVSEMAADVMAPGRAKAGDYHRYHFDGPVNLLKNDLTQMRLVTADGIKVDKSYRLISNVQRFPADGVEERSPAVVLTFANDKRNNLDVPIPAGIVRVYERDGVDENFIGEARVGHTPAGSEVELVTGRAFDLSAKRVQKGYQRRGDRAAEVAYSITLKNATDKPVKVRLVEKFSGQWKVTQQSGEGSRLDARTLVFDQSVPAKGESQLDYSVRMNW
ncbi:MAG: hypothetical protein HN816_03150 [Gammaproteobacteria bacterium]|nr:hypothetical protein [Gammaproteobacteria bacterium]